jgi:hypothetical protein
MMKNKLKCLMTLMVTVLLFTSCEKDIIDNNIDYPCDTGQWIDGCIHTLEDEPVCGCDGVTYDNSSAAECHGIVDYTPGECP